MVTSKRQRQRAPSAAARGRLVLTLRHGGRLLLRLVAAIGLVFEADSFWLFPLAFVLMVLSRVHGISRSALLPLSLIHI